MRLLVALAGLLVLAPAASASVTPAGYDADLRYAGGVLTGTHRVTFRNPGQRPARVVTLRLWAYGPRGCRTTGVSVTVARGGRVLDRALGCTAMRVRLTSPLRPGARGSIQLALSIRPQRDARRTGISRGAAYFGNALPLVSTGPLYPWAGDHAESFVSEVVPWRVRLRTPRGLRAVTTGTVRRDGVAVATARDFAFAIGKFRPVESRAAGVRIRFWRLPHTEERYARRAAHQAAVSVRVFSRWGAYPARELDLVDWEGGMEYPELVFTRTASIFAVHEVAHQWFYGLVGSDQYANPWLDESLSQYATERALDEIERGGGPRPEGHYRCREPQAAEAGRPMSYWRGRATYGPVVYLQGACVFTRLEGAMGVEKLDAALRAYVTEHRFAIATPGDLRRAIVAQAPPPGALAAFERAFGFGVGGRR